MVWKFVHQLFVEIFGRNILEKEVYTVYNDPLADTPMLVINELPVKIRLRVKSSDYWSQVVYQFSHELTHFVIRQYKSNKNMYVNWFEETICEAMSLYCLKKVAERWDECELYKINPGYRQSLTGYMEDEYIKKGSDILKNCNSYKQLMKIEEEATADRDARNNERNYLFNLFVASREYVRLIVQYPKYIRKEHGLLIDFDYWLNCEKESEGFLLKIKKIQPCFPLYPSVSP
jgi:hypothetical protein